MERISRSLDPTASNLRSRPKDPKGRGRWGRTTKGTEDTKEERLGEEERSLSDRINRIYRKEKGFSRRDAKTPREEGEGGK